MFSIYVDRPLIRRQNANLFTTPIARADAEGQLSRLIDNFQRSVALDTVRNEYVLHTRLHAWLIADPTRGDVDALNEKVYAELFLTPRSDPWLGLLSADTYTALEGGGVIGRREQPIPNGHVRVVSAKHRDQELRIWNILLAFLARGDSSMALLPKAGITFYALWWRI